MSGLDKLDAAMAAHAKKKQQIADTEKAQDVLRREFETSFEVLLETVVKPVFERVGNKLKRGGYDFRVESDPLGLTAAFHAYIDTTYEEHAMRRVPSDHPQVKIYADRIGRTVSFTSVRRIGGGTATGPEGSYSLEQVNDALVEDIVVKIVSSFLNG